MTAEVRGRLAGPTESETRTGSAAPISDAPLPARWGPLEVRERLGAGAAGEVYRAYDPALQTEVALKLARRPEAWSGSQRRRFLDEARRMARVRHPNVLAVRGAGDHDGRVGFWTDLIRGRSLEEYLRAAGPSSADEATLIGLDLCRALAQVHANGLVHRDVKTSNVMREEGGRIVLMDFGSMAEIAGADPRDPSGGLHGTLLVMPPEQLRGEPVDARADIYALGVLLYRMVTGGYPVEAASLPDLLERHARFARVALRDRRPDLPLDFVEVVERALAPDPAGRYPSAAAMERALAATLRSAGGGATVEVGGGQRSRWTQAATIAVLVVLLVIAWKLSHPPRRAPVPGPQQGLLAHASPLAARAALLRHTDSGDRVVPRGTAVVPGDRLALALEPGEPMYAYVLNEDEAGNAYVLFPIPGASITNPLSGSTRFRLPGSMGDSLIDWTVTSAGGREGILVIGSRSPLRDLEEVIASVPRAAPGRPVRYGRVDAARWSRLRSIGGIVKEKPVSGEEPRLIEAALRGLDERRKEKGDVWLWSTTLTSVTHTSDANTAR